MKIMIVEDNEDNRRLVRKRLRAAGHELLEAISGEEALKLMRIENPDMVLLDLQLPDMDGRQWARLVRNDDAFQHTVIVACTAFAMAGDRETALEVGCNGYLTKPVDIRLLPDQLMEIAHESRK